MKKRIFTSFLAIATCFTIFAVAVSAATPGDSDYKVTTKVDIASVVGDKVELTSTESKTVISIAKTALPSEVTSVTFAAKEMDKTSEVFVAANKLAQKGSYSNVVVFDYKLLDQNNAAIEKLNGKISITVACPKDVNTVLYYNDKDGTITELGGTVKDGFITFETDHFSYYVLAEKTTSNTQTSNPQTGDATPLILVAVVAIIVAGGLFTLKKFSKAK